ncbi:MAG: type II toxin-antitoxin system VapC family toxin [Bacteroidales bacterium]|nr:type II toxin-antitoxin system VapC family toxin [Bacteroidales bacterium]
MILLDTNIILRSKQVGSYHHKEVTEKLIELITSGEELVICPQIIYEFYVIATRPADKNGLGLSPETAIKEVINLLETYTMLEENEQVFFNWQQLIKEYKVSGKTAHDTRIVALMLANEITKLYTINQSDFKRYKPNIELI